MGELVESAVFVSNRGQMSFKVMHCLASRDRRTLHNNTLTHGSAVENQRLRNSLLPTKPRAVESAVSFFK